MQTGRGASRAPARGSKRPADALSPAAHKPQLFSGCRFVFWATSHMNIMKQRVQQLGGTLQKAVAADTTHVVCPSDLTAQKATTTLSGLCQGVPMGLDIVLWLPQGMAFVKPDWVARCITKQQLQPVEEFLPPGLAPALALPVHARQQQEQQQQQQQQQEEEQHEQPVAQAAGSGRQRDAAAAPSHRPTGSAVTVQLTAAELMTAQKDVQQEVHRGRPVCQVERRGSKFVAVQGTKPQYTGGDSNLPWGCCGVWDEPVDEAAARETVDKLRAYWFHTHTGGQQAPPTSTQPPIAEQRNNVCSHVCCSRRPFCVVSQLLNVKQAYLESREKDQFKRKAIDRGVQQLIMWNEPLDTDEDVKRMQHLGPKTEDKVKEILQTGSSSRVAAVAADEQLQVINMFLEVWGAGVVTATRWYSLGCRTLDDLRDRQQELNLTDQQLVGLKYFHHLRHKIPRAEIAQAEAVVREACFELVEKCGGLADVERTYCCATGSYKRGKPESSDIDFLICLPPSLNKANPHAFLKELLTVLLNRGLLLNELDPHLPQKPSTGDHGSWMGLCKPEGAPYIRRIDIKVYDNGSTPFAINYFANSQSFCRATRYWAKHGVTEAARRYNPEANGFKLSDRDLQPIYRQWQPGKRQGTKRARGGGGSSSEKEDERGCGKDGTVLGPQVRCADETAIFRELGLAYVPPTMRFFFDFF